MTHLHLDPLGGAAGDMFAAALLHADPGAEPDLRQAVHAATGATCRTEPADDGSLTGLRFFVDLPNHDHRHHDHAHWSAIRRTLTDGRLPDAVATRAVAIFTLLADAESRVHGVAPDDVVFHEVGAIDSIADIVAAAVLLARLAPTSASIAPLPIGGGRVDTAHGPMPVPAPATALLLEGLLTIDDGIGGERVTPTGAAILRHLAPAPRPRTPLRLTASGYGFGTRRLPNLSNCLRATLFAPAEPGAEAAPRIPHRRLAVITFEIDDQAGEDLAAGLERLRAADCIHDVVQIPAIGKKGRFAVQVQILADAARAEDAVDLAFRETTTIGLRVAETDARALTRRQSCVDAAGHDVRLKHADRPGGPTIKPEADDIASAGDAAARAARRAAAQAAATQTAATQAAATPTDPARERANDPP